MKRRDFTLVELLMVIGIIVLLAGLMIPAVTSSRTRGMITQAKADMNSIKLALLAVERDYKTIFKSSGGSFSFYKLSSSGGTSKSVSESVSGLPTGKTQLVLGGTGNKFSGKSVSNMVDGYYGMIAELSVPKDVTSSHVNINKRLVKYLDPRADYARGEDATMWQDPWGNPYVVMIDSDYDEKVYIPLQSSKVNASDIKNKDSDCLVLSGKVFLYSLGPNGEDDGGFNADSAGGKSTTDDIRGWEK